jgi:NADH:ubiquinone oxidoreductase subunit 3 (subunit A)
MPIDSQLISLFLLFIISALFSVILAGLAVVVAPSNDDMEKSSSYECGFEPFDNARAKFDIHFYLVAILFIIFDLEIILLFPWCLTAGYLSVFGMWSMIIFLVLLTVGFIYEWTKGALTWK